MTHIARRFAVFAAGAAILLAAGCAELERKPCAPCPACPQCPAPPGPAAASYREVPFSAIPGWEANAFLPGLRAFVAGCARIVAASALGGACEAARAAPPADEAAARAFFEQNFAAHAIISADGSTRGLVTGYYEPVLAGSRTRTERHRVPLYGVPPDLVVVDLAGLHPELRHMRLRGRIDGRRLVPYWSRAEIEQRARDDARSGGSAPGAPVLAWVEDPVEAFFLQIQGSGQIALAAGGRMRLAYADQNGHPYRSLGRYLVDRGELTLEQASMQGIKAWAAANPAKLQDALNANASFVFFRELEGAAADSGPVGALGVPLSAQHSIAVDPRYVPLGAPVFLATTYPLSSRPLERLVAAQDTGGAIRGAVRADFFWGTGPEAGLQAGRMRQQGSMWILWPRGQPLPLLD
jgi:membrane-bound lytic murein transglycosylase A